MYRSLLMRDGAHRARAFANQARNIARSVNGNSVKGGDEARFLGANGHASAAFDTGVPVDVEDDRDQF